MEITISPELEKFVHEQVAAGRFSSPSEVFEAGLARIMLDDKFDCDLDDEDIAAIEESERQIAAGEAIPLRDVIAEFRRDGLIK